jgi:hypothetical protein
VEVTALIVAPEQVPLNAELLAPEIVIGCPCKNAIPTNDPTFCGVKVTVPPEFEIFTAEY